MEWVVEDVTSANGSGNLEFSVKGGNEDDFFPTSVEFESGETFLKAEVCVGGVCDVKVTEVKLVDEETPVSFSQSRSLRVSNYTIA